MGWGGGGEGAAHPLRGRAQRMPQRRVASAPHAATAAALVRKAARSVALEKTNSTLARLGPMRTAGSAGAGAKRAKTWKGRGVSA